jgi:phosphoenolpyruvate carboxylase
MKQSSVPALQQFKDHVGIRFQLYNSLFTSLPFHRIEKTGIFLSLLLNQCEEGYKKKWSPLQIIDDFFQRFVAIGDDKSKTDMLFRFVQYVERQVVLFDALEDAAFKYVTDVHGTGSLKHLESEVVQWDMQEGLQKGLETFSVQLVLTAHPTQFYPGTVLGIINDLAKALTEDNAALINTYLQQLGKTPFFKKQKPTPYDEAVSLIWYLENVFYTSVGRIATHIDERFFSGTEKKNNIVKMGFWPGGDRDGNPNVTAEITLKVADALRSSILKCYYLDVRRLKRRLTFEGVEQILGNLENQLYNNVFIPGNKTELSQQQILESLQQIRELLIQQHNGLFLDLLENLISKVQVFGLYFATLDIRQESSVHNTVLEAIAESTNTLPRNYCDLSPVEKINVLTSIDKIAAIEKLDGIAKDTIASVQAIKTIQQYNGEGGCNRYIISQCNSALNVLEVYGLFLLGGWQHQTLHVDIVPLFETIEDLQQAPAIMESLYQNPTYQQHLRKRGNRQTIMVGFSDGTKDGGYLMANWSIYKAKEALTSVSMQYGVDVVFFDGRGGPPARGGGKTHKFYASMGRNISGKEIQLTIQGQTVSSSFGAVDAARYNIEQLIHAGISNALFDEKEKTLSQQQDGLLQELAAESYVAYKELKNHPLFLDYLVEVSPLNFYSETNIGSRPAKRGGSSKITLKDLRAIPFVGAWSQLKQNVPGYYGVGTALQQMDAKGKLKDLKALYQSSLFFRTLMDNCEMAMKKSFFPLTAFLADHPKYGELWQMIYDEFELTQKYLLVLSGKGELMEDYPVEQLSIQMRERVVLPLTTIQQYAIARLRKMEEEGADASMKTAFEKLVIRCSFGIINAGRNSV